MMVATTSVILFSFRCVLGFAADDAWWYPFCRLKHYCSVCVVCGDSTCKTDTTKHHPQQTPTHNEKRIR